MLFFDTETTGLDIDGDFRHVRVVELAWIIPEKNVKRGYLIYPNGFDIPKGAERKHHISTALAKQKGMPVGDVFAAMLKDAQEAKVTTIAAYNIAYDKGVMLNELDIMSRTQNDIDRRLAFDMKNFLFTRCKSFCVMKQAAAFLKQIRYVKLCEIYQILFDKPFVDAHRALADTEVCVECYDRITSYNDVIMDVMFIVIVENKETKAQLTVVRRMRSTFNAGWVATLKSVRNNLILDLSQGEQRVISMSIFECPADDRQNVLFNLKPSVVKCTL